MKYSGKALAIIEIARKLFSEQGFKGVTTKEIAQRAGVNEVTIFRHFKSKDQLFDEVINYIISKPDVGKYLNPNEPKLEKYLLGMGNLIHSVFISNFDVFRIELLERSKFNDTMKISRFPNRIKGLFMDYLMHKQGYATDEAETFSVCYMVAVHGLCMNIYLLKTFDSNPDFGKSLKFLIRAFQ